jgi:hypothetical protein
MAREERGQHRGGESLWRPQAALGARTIAMMTQVGTLPPLAAVFLKRE